MQSRDRFSFANANKPLQLNSSMPFNQFNVSDRQRSLTQFAETFSNACTAFNSKVGMNTSERTRNIYSGNIGNMSTRDRNTGSLPMPGIDVRHGNSMEVGPRNSMGIGPCNTMGIGPRNSMDLGLRNAMDSGPHNSMDFERRNSMDVGPRGSMDVVPPRFGTEEFNMPRQVSSNMPFDVKTAEKPGPDENTKVMLDQISYLTKQVSKLVKFNEMLQEKVTTGPIKDINEGLKDATKDFKKPKCWICHEEGHFRRDCPRGKSPPRQSLPSKMSQFGHQDKDKYKREEFLSKDKEPSEMDFSKKSFGSKQYLDSGPFPKGGSNASLPHDEQHFTSSPLPHNEQHFVSGPSNFSEQQSFNLGSLPYDNRRFSSPPRDERRYASSSPRGERRYASSPPRDERCYASSPPRDEQYRAVSPSRNERHYSPRPSRDERRYVSSPPRGEHHYTSLHDEPPPQGGDHFEPRPDLQGDASYERPPPHDRRFSPRPFPEDEPHFHERSFIPENPHVRHEGSRREEKQMGQSLEKKCWLCGEEGHMRRDCKLNRSQSMERRSERIVSNEPLDKRYSRMDDKPVVDSRSFDVEKQGRERERREEMHNFERKGSIRSRDRSRNRIDEMKSGGRPYFDSREGRGDRQISRDLRRSKPKRCYICGKEGHFMDNCKLRGQPPIERDDMNDRRRIEQKLRDEARKIDRERELLRSKRKQLERERDDEDFPYESRMKRSHGGTDFEDKPSFSHSGIRRIDNFSRRIRY